MWSGNGGQPNQNRTLKISEIGEEWQFQWDILVKHGKFRGEHGKFQHQIRGFPGHSLHPELPISIHWLVIPLRK